MTESGPCHRSYGWCYHSSSWSQFTNAGHKGFADVPALLDGPLLGLGLGVAQVVQQERDHGGVEIVS